MASAGAEMADTPSQIDSESGRDADHSKSSKQRGFSEAYEDYAQTFTALRAFASELNPAVQESARKAQSLMEEAVNTLVKSFGISPEQFKELSSEELSSEEFKGILAANKPDKEVFNAAVIAAGRLLKQATKYSPHEQIMRGSVLLSLVSAFEVLLSDLLRLFFERHTTALESEEKNYSLKDIREFKTLADFLDNVIQHKIDAFLRGSLDDWVTFFKQKKIDMTRFVWSWESFKECFQRRHVIVHNGRRVNRQYLERVGQEWVERHKEEAQLGKILLVDNDYLSQAFNYFELVGLLLCQECWKRFAREEQDERGSAVCRHQYECLNDGKWIVAEGLGSWSVSEGEMAQSDTLIVRINRWLSIKRQGRWSEIEVEVAGFDHSVLNLRLLQLFTHWLRGTICFFRFYRKRDSRG